MMVNFNIMLLKLFKKWTTEYFLVLGQRMDHFISHNLIQKRKDAEVIKHGFSFKSIKQYKRIH